MPARRLPEGRTARLDISYAAEGRRTYVDVTVRHPRAAKYISQAAVTDGAAAGTAESGKRRRYPSLPAAGLEAAVPFAVETFGRLGPTALKLLQSSRQRAIERCGGLQTALFSRWLAQLSCSLARSLHEAARAMRGEGGHLKAEQDGAPLFSTIVASGHSSF